MFKKLSTFNKWFLVIGVSLEVGMGIYNKSSIFSIIQSLFALFSAISITEGIVYTSLFNIIACTCYTIISFNNRYFSEVIFNLVFSIPMSIYTFIQWRKHKSEDEDIVEVNELTIKEIILAILSQVALSFVYYKFLKYFNTEMLVMSTITLALNVLSEYFCSRRSYLNYYVYILNCVIKIILWIKPLLNGDFSTMPTFIGMIMYGISDVYGVYNWKKLQKKQAKAKEA